MISDIIIRAPKKHFMWLEHCLRSICKFATGFRTVHLCVPVPDAEGAEALVSKAKAEFPTSIQFAVHDAVEWPSKGMLFGMWQILNSDKICAGADLSFNVDTDCIFFEPVTPDDYIVNGKPRLIRHPYTALWEEHKRWQTAAQNCLGFPVEYETMTQHPLIHIPEVCAMTRSLIKNHTGYETIDYVYRQRNSFPQSLAEFTTMGAVALKFFPERYHILTVGQDDIPKRKILQFWSHGPLDKEGDYKDQSAGRFGKARAIDIINEVI